MSGLVYDPLYLACTRPAMTKGVPLEGFYTNLLGTFFFGMFMGSPWWWAVYFPIHWAMRSYANKNPNFFRECRVWYATKGRNAGGTLYALPNWNARKAKEISSSV